MSEQHQEQKAKKSVSIRAVLLLLFAAAVTVFAVMNWTLVKVWPLGTEKPLSLVIGLAFAAGAATGWLAQSILNVKRALRRRAREQ